MTGPGATALQALPTAAADPDRPAVISDSGETLTYGELALRAAKLAGALRARGVQAGDVVALLCENSPAYFEMTWACRLAAVYYVTLNTSLGVEELDWTIHDSGATTVIASSNVAATADLTPERFPKVRSWILRGEGRPGWESYDAAAPCPVNIRRRMIGWWGPIVSEYWSSSEGAGFTAVFSYHNDAEKDAESTSRHGWRSVGDVGLLDEDGYLYLTDRRSFMIITGGVNIYPQEAENVLVEHPKVYDAAVVGLPDDDLGEIAVAVVQALDPAEAGDELAAELTAWCQSRLARYKVPRCVRFTEALPRTETGKLLKRKLRDDLVRES